MKKIALCILMFAIILGTAGCRQEEKFITADEVTVNTILAKSNGMLQVATVEDFSKEYYELNELKNFIAEEVGAYNKKAGGDKVIIDDVKSSNGKAIMLLTYTGMDQYAAFNEVSAAYFSGGVENVGLNLPETLVNAKDGTLSSTSEILKDAKNRILVMYEPYDIIVEGKIKYYSDNAKMLSNDTIQSAPEGQTIVVFKP
jgi:hypothetical protein